MGKNNKIMPVVRSTIQKKTGDNTENVSAVSKKKITFRVALGVIVITVLLMMAVSNSVTLNEYTRETASLKKEIAELEKLDSECQLELDKKINLVEIEEYAYYNLGMIKGNSSSEVTVKRGEDIIEAYSANESEKGIIATILGSLFENFGETWNNLTEGE